MHHSMILRQHHDLLGDEMGHMKSSRLHWEGEGTTLIMTGTVDLSNRKAGSFLCHGLQAALWNDEKTQLLVEHAATALSRGLVKHTSKFQWKCKGQIKLFIFESVEGFLLTDMGFWKIHFYFHSQAVSIVIPLWSIFFLPWGHSWCAAPGRCNWSQSDVLQQNLHQFCWVSDCWIWGVREPPQQREDRAWGGRSKCHCSSILYGDIIRQLENLPCYNLDLDNRYTAMQVGHEWFTCRRLKERWFILFAQHWAMALWHSSGAFSGCWTNSGGRAAHDATAAGKGLISSKSSKCWSWCGNLQNQQISSEAEAQEEVRATEEKWKEMKVGNG